MSVGNLIYKNGRGERAFSLLTAKHLLGMSYIQDKCLESKFVVFSSRSPWWCMIREDQAPPYLINGTPVDPSGAIAYLNDNPVLYVKAKREAIHKRASYVADLEPVNSKKNDTFFNVKQVETAAFALAYNGNLVAQQRGKVSQKPFCFELPSQYLDAVVCLLGQDPLIVEALLR